MEKQKSSNVLSIVAICLSVIGLAIGFAAFSNNLVIDQNAVVAPDSANFKVALSQASNSLLTGEDNKVVAVSSGYTGNNAAPTGEGVITEYNNGSSSINISSNFTDIGQTLTYTFYGVNKGDYTAYLNSIAYSNGITCTPSAVNGGTKNMVDIACGTIEMTVQATSTGGNNDTTTLQTYNKNTAATTFNPAAEHSLTATTGYDTIVVTVKYNGSTNADENYAKADGSFDVKFGTITFNYASTDIAH